MSRQWAAYSLVDGDMPQPSEQIQIGYDPSNPAGKVKIVFPPGHKTLTQDQLTELGVLFLALARQETTAKVDELLVGFGLDPPPHLEPPPTCRQIAREIMDNFIQTFPDVREEYRDKDELRIQVEEAMARGIARCTRQKV